MAEEGEGWRQLWLLEITAGLAGAWTVLGLALLVASGIALAALDGALHPDAGRASAVAVLGSLLLSMPVALVLHEAVHGLAFLAFGGRPRFGAGVRAGMPYLFTGCPGRRFSRDQFLVVGLAPLVVLDLAGLALMLPAWSAAFGASMAVLNTGGAVGDLWMSGVLLQLPRWVQLEDIGVRFVAWAPPAHAGEAALLRRPIGLDAPALRWVGPWLIVTLAAAVLLAPVVARLAAALPGRELRLGPLLVAQAEARGARLNVLAVTLLAGLVGAATVALLAAVRASWRARRR